MMLGKICPFISSKDKESPCLEGECMLFDTNDCAIMKLLDAIESKKED